MGARIELAGGGAQSDGLADADLAGDDAQERLADAKADARDGFLMAGPIAQLAGWDGLLKGVRVNPKWLTQGARVMTAGPGQPTRQVAVGDLAEQLVVMLGHDQAQVIDAGGR